MGIPSKIINTVKALYADFECAVVDAHDIDTTRHVDAHDTTGNTGIRWKFTTKLEDLDFVDDIALLSSTRQHIQTKTDKFAHEAERVGLKVNADKCKLLRINSRNNDVVEVNGRG